jgi:cytochrome c-type biogenesis protein
MSEGINVFLVFVAGLTSVLSPCVLPVVPIVVLGPESETRTRPLLVVVGLAVTFVLMGVLSTLFAAAIGPAMVRVEKAAALAILAFGVLMFADVNIFKRLSFLTNLGGRSRAGMGGFMLGATLGVIWIPCIGPVLSAVLAMVAAEGGTAAGVLYLLVYSAGFAVPLLAAGYASRTFRSHLGVVRDHPTIYRVVSGLLLIALGAFILTKGMVAFGGF